MKCFMAKFCVVLLMFNSVAFAGGLQHGIIGKAKQIGIGALATIMLTCGTIACSKDKVGSETPKAEVAALSYDQSTTIGELQADIEQLEGAQIGVIRSVDYSQGAVTIETADGVVSTHLAKGEMLVNNGETDLEVILSEEAFDEGLIAEGSLIAIIPAIVVTGVGLSLTGMGAFMGWMAHDDSTSILGTITTIGVISLVSLTAGFGTYHALVML